MRDRYSCSLCCSSAVKPSNRGSTVRCCISASAAAMRVGYESPSQFSREFKRYFGLTPGEDAARIRTMQGM